MAAALGLAGDQLARLGGELTGLLGGRASREAAGVGISSACELLDQQLDPRRVGLLVDAVERARLAPLEVVGDLLVGEHHQLLDQAVRLGLLDAVRADHVAVVGELELGLGAS